MRIIPSPMPQLVQSEVRRGLSATVTRPARSIADKQPTIFKAFPMTAPVFRVE